MKKLRMIVTSVVLLAIVGSAFSFHAKFQRFCVLTTTAIDDICTTALDLPRRTTNGLGIQYKYDPTFDGDKTACADHAHHCTATATLTVD